MSLSDRLLQLDNPWQDCQLWLTELWVEEKYNSPGSYRLKILSNNLELEKRDWSARSLNFSIHCQNQPPRYFSGYVDSLVADEIRYPGYRSYGLTLRNWLGLLDQELHSRGYINQSVLACADGIFRRIIHRAYYDLYSKLENQYANIPYSVQWQETDLNFVNRIFSENQLFYWLEYRHAAQKMQLRLADNVHAYQRILETLGDYELRTVYQQGEQTQYHLKTGCLSVGLGQVLPAGQDRFVPTCIQHYAVDKTQLPINFNQKAVQTYYNEVTAMDWPLKEIYLPTDCYQKPSIAGMELGEVRSAVPDAKARVQVWFPWDENNPEKISARCPWVPVLQEQHQADYGHQFIPRLGAKVGVMYQAGEPALPIVVRCFEKQQEKSMVSSLSSPAGHRIVFDDTENKAHLLIQSAQDLEKSVGGEHERVISGFEHVTVMGDALESVLQGHYFIRAQQGIHLYGGASRISLTENAIQMNASAVEFKTQGSQAALGLSSLGDTQVCPQQNHQGLPIAQGSNNVFLNGQAAARVGDYAHCSVSGARVKNPLVEGCPNLLINNQLAVAQMHQTAHGGHVTKGSHQLTAGGDPTLQASQAQTQDLSQAILIRFVMSDHDQASKHPWIYYHQFLLKRLSDEKLRRFSIDTKTGKTLVPETPGGEYQCWFAPGEQSRGALPPRQFDFIKVNKKACLPYYRAAFNVPAAPNSGDEPDSAHQFNASILWPMVILDLRDEVGHDPQQAEHDISEHDIQYWINNGNNVTVFIHGFSIPWGKFSRQFSGIEPFTGELIKSSENATVYRSYKTLQKQFNHPFSASDFPIDEALDSGLNGTGAQQWFINMEKCFNEASQKFHYLNPKTYLKYTRCLNVTWSGNPDSQTNYVNAIPKGLAAGQALAKILLRLKQHGLKVNVVAHSLGNAVLLGALESLGKTAPETIDHAFMWEAAVPNDVFNRPKPTAKTPDYIKQWYSPHAINGAKKISVLYSDNDNVIGPIPKKQKLGLKQNVVNQHKPFWDELVPALVCTHLGFESLYIAAMWVGVSFHDLLFNAERQCAVYQYWLEQHPELQARFDAKENPALLEKQKRRAVSRNQFLPTLEEQVKYSVQQDRRYFSNLMGKFISLENAINQQLKAAKWGNQGRWRRLKNEFFIYLSENLLDYIWIQLQVGASPDSGLSGIAVDHVMGSASVKQCACLLRMMKVIDKKPKPALGTKGVDKRFLDKNRSKFLQVDQHKWLWSHCGMKHPTKALMENVYHPEIFKKMAGGFGTYSQD